MRTKKSKDRQRLDGLIQEGLALLICELSQKMRETDDLIEAERRTHQIERLSEVYRRVGD